MGITIGGKSLKEYIKGAKESVTSINGGMVINCNGGKPDKGGGTYVHASMDATGSPCFVKRKGKTEYEKFYGRKK
ncbi:MAG: hypothetical protein IJ640_09050 [Prevotella sp.]|nr:hypothetical protein [Prevotella sp.]